MLALAALLALPAAAQPAPADDLPGRVGRVADVGGELFIAPQDRPDQWQAAGVNYPVAGGDNLWVGRDGRAEIDFGAGQLRLAGDSNIHVSRLDDRQFAVFVAQGRVQVRVRVLDPGETARIDTPNAQVVITRSGAYRIDVSEDRQHTLLVVREGEANVLTMGAVQQVLPGQSAYVDGMDPQFADVRNGVGSDGFDAWAASRDRLYMRGQYSTYVSPQMVGAAELDRYGTWSQVPEYGAIWYPNDVGADWAPYRNGYWTEVGGWGPTWVDAAPWGYAPFHYGRWAWVGGRWGWCPGRYVARPLWAPALVAWTGGPGWSVSVTAGGPVYGWVPLAWGEPYRPWWNRCSYGCWDRYNKPYAVNTAVYRPNGPPLPRYANWNAPNAVTVVPANSLVNHRPVAQNLVRVPREALSAAPVLATAPTVRYDTERSPSRRPVENAPAPASTFYPTNRPASFNSGAPAPTQVGRPDRTGQPSAVQVPSDTRVPNSALRPTTPAPSSATPVQPSPSAAFNRPGRDGQPPASAVTPTTPGNTVRPTPSNAAPLVPPSSNAQRPAPGPATATPSSSLPYTRELAPQPGPAPQDARTGRSPTSAPTPAPDVRPQGRPAQGIPVPSSMAPPSAPAAPVSRPAPSPQPQAAPQPMTRSLAPSAQQAPAAAPAPAPQPRNANPPAPPPASSSGSENLRRDDRGRGDGGQGQGQDRPGR